MTKIDEDDILEAADQAEDLAWSLGMLCHATEEMLKSGLTEDAIVCLLKEKVGNKVAKTGIRGVLRALPKLREFLVEKEVGGAS